MRNATLGTALGRLQRMRETQEWRGVRDMPKGKARTKAFSAVHKAFGLTEFGLTIIANNHRKASGRKDMGVSGFLCLGRLFQGQPNEAALCSAPRMGDLYRVKVPKAGCGHQASSRRQGCPS